MKTLSLSIGLFLPLVSLSFLRGDDRKADTHSLPPAAEGKVSFLKDIQPILERSCLRCHFSPKPPKTVKASDAGGLSLSTRERALKGGREIGVVILPGKSAESLLIHLVSGFPHEKSQTPAMPPSEKDRLSKEDIGKLRAWIDQGAVWPKVNTAKKSLDGVALFTATIAQETRANEPVSISLQLKNLGDELLVFNDGPLNAFLLTVKTKDGTVVPATRYLEFLGRSRTKGRDVQIELAPGKQAGVTLPLDRLFDLSLDGEYVVSVEARFTVKRVPGKIAIENLPFTIGWVRPFLRITEVK